MRAQTNMNNECDEDIILAITDSFNGPRAGITTYRGKKLFFQSNNADLVDEGEEFYYLFELDDDILKLVFKLQSLREYMQHKTSTKDELSKPTKQIDEISLTLEKELRVPVDPDDYYKVTATFQNSPGKGVGTVVYWKSA